MANGPTKWRDRTGVGIAPCSGGIAPVVSAAVSGALQTAAAFGDKSLNGGKQRPAKACAGRYSNSDEGICGESRQASVTAR